MSSAELRVLPAAGAAVRSDGAEHAKTRSSCLCTHTDALTAAAVIMLLTPSSLRCSTSTAWVHAQSPSGRHGDHLATVYALEPSAAPFQGGDRRASTIATQLWSLVTQLWSLVCPLCCDARALAGTFRAAEPESVQACHSAPYPSHTRNSLRPSFLRRRRRI
jgi:hypothetical protein